MRAPLAYSFLVLLPLTLCMATAGCGVPGRGPAGGGPGQGPGPTPQGGLAISPVDPVLSVNGKDSQKLSFQVTRGAEDVTAQASFYVDDQRLGSFAGATFHTNPGAAGKTRVRATVGNDTATTSLTV